MSAASAAVDAVELDKQSESAKSAKRGRKPIVLAAMLVLVAAGAGGWTWMQRSADHAANPVHEARKPLYVPLEPFTVNLQESRGDRFAQIGVTLQYEDPSIEERVKDNLPAIRNNVLMLLSSKQVEDLLSPEGKAHLADEIRERTGAALIAEPVHGAASVSAAAREAANPIRAVLFTQFIVQ